MAGIQPLRYPLSARNMAANMGLANRSNENPSPATINMASGENLLFPRPEGATSTPPAANPRQPYSMATMEYFYPRLQIGVTEPMLVTQVLDPHHIFCQLRCMSHEIQRLSDAMHQYYEVHQQSCGDQPLRLSLALGQPCASYGEDDQWHRSLLQEFFPEKHQAVVIHVDSGKKEVLAVTRLRNLASEFFRLPVYTIPCTMGGISNNDFGWDPMFVADLRALLLQKHVVAKIECYNSYEHFYVVNLFAEDGMNFNGLVGMKLKIPRTCPVKMMEPPPESITKIPVKKPQQAPYNLRYPPVELKTDKFEDAVVESIIDPSNFWVRIEKFADKHKEMITGMTTLYSQASKLEGIITEPKPGQLCCARYHDLYYRAEVISVDKKQVKVFFLDNGILETMDWYNIKELPTGFSKLPALANKCCLADTYPLENAWSQEAIIAFKVAVSDKKLVIYVMSKDADEYTIEILDQSRIQETSIGKILANEGLARFEEIDSVHSHTSSKVAHVESVKSDLNPSVKVQKIAPADLYDENSESLLFSPFEEQLFEPGTTIKIVVSNIDHPGYFWCQDAASKQDLQNLMSVLQNHCVSTNCPYIDDSLACLAKSAHNRIWYRAMITEDLVDMLQASTVEVLFVDYGKREIVPVENLRALNSEFFQLKAQAFRCSVYNIISPTGNNPFVWDDKAIEVFKDFVQNSSKGTEFHCLVYATAYMDNELFHIVDLTTPFSSASDTLVKSGSATPLHHTSLAPSVQLLSYYYTMHGIKYGNDEEIFIKHVDSSLMFYVQLIRSGSALKQISSNITKFIEKSQKKKLPSITGALCLAKSSDRRWYRGLILSKDEVNQIFFVDFGNTENVSNQLMLPIPSTECDLLLMPMQAIKCSLIDIPPKVPAEIVSWFKDIALHKSLRAQVVSKDSHGTLSVELYDGDCQINAVIKSKLGLKVPKEKSDHLAPDQPRAFKQDHFTKIPDNASNQERTTSFSVGKTLKNRESNFHSHSAMRQEPEPPRYRQNPTFQNKVENKDNSRRNDFSSQQNPTFQNKGENKDNSRRNDFSSQKKTEGFSKLSSSGSSQGRDSKQCGNKTASQSQASAIASEHKSQPKLPVVMLTDIPVRKIFPGMKEHVYVSQTNSIFDFYVQVAEDKRLDEMSDILNSKMSSSEDLRDEDVRVGNVICAYFPEDGLYYRGMVKGTSKEGLSIQYIDYGNVTVISNCKNYRLPQKCLSIPIMSIRCSLNKSEKASSAPNLEEMLAEFSKRTSDVLLDCEFVKQDGLKWEVILKDELGCINDLLNEEEKNVEEVNRMVMEIAREEETSVQSFPWNLPPLGVAVKVYISTAYSPDCFWCQLSEADINSLASQVHEAGERCAKNDEFIGALKIGSPCNVLFSDDNHWYRALVTKMDAVLVTVRFIDYGNEDSVRRDQIRQLPASLVNFPPQAFSCCLANFDTKDGTWLSEGKQYFYERFTEDALDLTVLEVQESAWCQIPMAIVTIDYKDVNINEEMKNFWQGVQSMDLEPDDLSSVDVMKTDQLHRSLAGEDRPLQKDVTGDDVYPDQGEEQESETDDFKDIMDLSSEEHEGLDEAHIAQMDSQDFGGDVESDPSSFGANEQFPDPRSSCQQELSQGTSESVAGLIVYFNEKFDPTNKEAISADTAEKEGTKQELDKEAVCAPSESYVESKDLLATNAALEITKTPLNNIRMENGAFSEIVVTSDELNECRNTLGSEASEVSIEDMDKVEEAALSITTQEGTMMETKIINVDIVPLIVSDVHKMETIITHEKVVGTDTLVTIDTYKESEAVVASENITGEDIVDSNVTAQRQEIHPKDVFNLQEEIIQEVVECSVGMNICEDYMPLVLGHVDEVEINDSFDSLARADGEEGLSSEAIESFRVEDVCGYEETTSIEGLTKYLESITSEDFGQSEEESSTFNITECGEMTTKDYEAIQAEEGFFSPEGTSKEACVDFEEFKATSAEVSLIDFSQDFEASRGEELVSSEHLKLHELYEEFVAKEDLKREAASFEDFYCDYLSTDEPEPLCPADDTEMRQRETEQEQPLPGISAEDVCELPAEDVTSERDEQPLPGISAEDVCELPAEDVTSERDEQPLPGVSAEDVCELPAEDVTSERDEQPLPGISAEDVCELPAEDVTSERDEQPLPGISAEDVCELPAEDVTSERDAAEPQRDYQHGDEPLILDKTA
ncbi:tudor domain-containing protein 6 [Anomaloglossus baeobatrachus]|uniref:tudor domain-containing protein 6 n=1 Tax=Anomaloglossus baeobatrachus TaxID=238106 RepID=UPI003F50B81B